MANTVNKAIITVMTNSVFMTNELISDKKDGIFFQSN